MQSKKMRSIAGAILVAFCVFAGLLSDTGTLEAKPEHARRLDRTACEHTTAIRHGTWRVSCVRADDTTAQGKTSHDRSALPLPPPRRAAPAEEASGLRIGDGITIDGKTNFNENRYGEAPLHKLNPRPKKSGVNAGPQVDFRF